MNTQSSKKVLSIKANLSFLDCSGINDPFYLSLLSFLFLIVNYPHALSSCHFLFSYSYPWLVALWGLSAIHAPCCLKWMKALLGWDDLDSFIFLFLLPGFSSSFSTFDSFINSLWIAPLSFFFFCGGALPSAFSCPPSILCYSLDNTGNRGHGNAAGVRYEPCPSKPIHLHSELSVPSGNFLPSNRPKVKVSYFSTNSKDLPLCVYV